MESRKLINEKVVAWITNKVKTEYADDISLVLLYGSYINGTANSKSDVDCYYIPKTERGYEMAVDFMIDGVGYDIFPISWERAAGIADLQESLLPLIGDVQIIYYRAPEDLEHFQALQEKLKSNLLDDVYVGKIAADRCAAANNMCAQMNAAYKASEIRKLAGNVIMTLADAIAVAHHDYFHYGLKKQYEDLQNNFPDVPEGIAKNYRDVVEADSVDEVKSCAMKMFQDVCEYLNLTFEPQEAVVDEVTVADKVNVGWLAGLYEEISSTFNKIYICCETGNAILAFLSAVCLQRDLDEAGEAGCPAYDLLGDFNYKELDKLAIKAETIEQDLVRLITENGGCIKKYGSYEEFEKAGL